MNQDSQQQSIQGTVFGTLSIFGGILIPILGVILSVTGLAKSNKNDDTLGLILSVIGLMLSAIHWILGALIYIGAVKY